MRATLLSVILLVPFSSTARADDAIFADIEEIYASAVERIVQEHKRDDRHLAITFADIDRHDGAATDKPLWSRLKKRLTAEGIDPERHLVSGDEVIFQEENLRFIEKSTDRIVWVYQITGFEWHGSDRVAICREVCRDTIDYAFEPPSLVFAHRAGKWQLVDENSSGKGDRSQQATAADNRPLLITDLEAIYMAAFSSFVRGNDRPDRVYCIALATDRNGDLLQVPEPFAKRLQAGLGDRTRSGFVPAEQVAWSKPGMRYYHEPTGKDTWVYSIGPIEWHGADRLHVPISVNHGNLAGGGETLVFVKSGETWTIVGRMDQWVS
ncbi:MAG: hypothetical protein ACYC0X_26505 [Pirellulaceae bacterium]